MRARKYRPRTFDQMVGLGAVVRALTSALSTGRLPHAYLFTGTRGIGKTTVSRIPAKSLNCAGEAGRGGATAQPVRRSRPCPQIARHRHVAVVQTDAALKRSKA